MRFSDTPVLLRGGGDLSTGVAYRLHKAGFPIVIFELPRPLVVRRRVALATAVLEDHVEVEGMHGRLVAEISEALDIAKGGTIPVLVSPELPEWINRAPAPSPQPPGPISLPPFPILVDARMAKRKLDTRIDQANLVIALGPGYVAGEDCHAVIETMRGHRLGRVIWRGSAFPNTGTPGIVAGKDAERVLRAPVDGVVSWRCEIGDRVVEGQQLGEIGSVAVRALFDGVLRGLIAPGSKVTAGLKVGDLDARGDVSACFTISDKALAIGGGVLEAILTWFNEQE
jgi:xanthine dehydrogenase accessory factor